MMNPIPAEPRNDAYAREHSPVKREGVPDEERDALVNALRGSRFFESHDWTGTGAWPGEEYIRWELGELADDILPALRRQGSITDERKAIDDAVAEFLGATFTDAVTDAFVDHIVRALEAARSAP